MNDTEQTTFAQDILKAAKGEPIEAIVIGQGNYSFRDDERSIPEDKRNRVLSWDEAKPLLDYKYDDGFGGEDCHAIYAWTPTRVLFVGCYDGSTWVTSVPRNPQDGEPGMKGGG